MLHDPSRLAQEILDARPPDAPLPTDAELRAFLDQKNKDSATSTEKHHVAQLREAVQALRNLRGFA